MKTSEQHSKERWILVSTGLNLALALAKGVWGFSLGGGTVVLAGAAHSASDILGAALVYGAIRWSAHRSERFPFGLYKLEDLAAVTGSLAVVGVAIGILAPLLNKSGIVASERPWETVVFMGGLALIQALFVIAERKAATRLRSPGLASDAINWLGDIAADLVVVVGVVVSALGIPYAQESAVAIIGIAVVHSAWPVFRNALWALLDASAPDDEVERVRTIVLSQAAVSRLRRVRVRRAGSMSIVDLTVDISSASFDQAHEAVDAIEEELRTNLDGIETVTIHYEPDRPQGRCARLLTAQMQAASSAASAEWIEVYQGQNMIRRLPNPSRDSDLTLSAWLLRAGIDVVELSEVHGDLAQLLEGLGVATGVCGAPKEREAP